MTDPKSWRGPDAIPADALCSTQIYVIWGVDPWLRGLGLVPLWIGETAREPLERIAEHFADKYWRKDIRRIDILDEVYPTKRAAWVEERRLTLELQPVYPTEYNQRNPWRIYNGRGVHQRLPQIPASWDFNPVVKQRGVPRQYPPQRTPPADVEGYLRRRARIRWLAALWVALVMACSFWMRDYYDGGDVLWSGVVLATGVMVVGWLLWRRWTTPKPRRPAARGRR